jgi:maleylacetoacetate isomerase
MSTSELILYTFSRSSSSARLRIALNYKSLPAHYTYVNLDSNEQFTTKYASLNPSKSVPTLVVQDPGATSATFPITQSLAALEYLEEAYPSSPSLLPPLSNPVARAKVRTLVNIIVSDTQPINKMSVIAHLGELGQDWKTWAQKFMARGLDAYEEAASKTAGKYSVGDDVTLADVVLVPQCWNAGRVGLELSRWPTVQRIFGEMEKLEAVQNAHWTKQADADAK